MSYTIKFKGIDTIIPAIIVYSSKQQVTSYADINKIDNREVLQIHFPELTDYNLLMQAYSSEDALSEITITDSDNSQYIYMDYVIRVSLSLNAVESDPTDLMNLAANQWIMTIAQLTPTDKELRKIVDTINGSPSALTLQEYKEARIAQSKTLLEKFLNDHPLISACKNNIFAPYTATTEKQNLFMNQCVTYYFNTINHIEDTLMWNERGKPCTVWTMEEAIKFMNGMKAYTKPLVSTQQQYEVDILALPDKAAVEAYVIDYSTVPVPNGRLWWVGYTVTEVQLLIEHFGDTEEKPKGADEYLHGDTNI